MTDQKKVLKFQNTHRLYYFDHILQREVEGAHNELKNYEKIYGNCTSIKGDVKNIYGNCSGVSGICSQKLKGCITAMYGDVTGVEGDLDLIERDRKTMKESDRNGYSHYRIQDYTITEDQMVEEEAEAVEDGRSFPTDYSKDQDKIPARSDDGWPTAEFLDIPENIKDIKTPKNNGFPCYIIGEDGEFYQYYEEKKDDTIEFTPLSYYKKSIDNLNILLENSHKRENHYLKALYSLLAVWAFTFILLLLK